MAFNNVIPSASGVVPPATRASTGRHCYLQQNYNSAHFAAVNSQAGKLSRNLLQMSAPSFLYHYSIKTSSDDQSLLRMTPPNHLSLGRGNKNWRKRRAPIEAYCSSETKAKMDALENELSNIVGMHALELQLRNWAKGMLLDEKRRALGHEVGDGRPPHMVFLRNPGTGKTMVARLLGKLLHMVGILPTDKVTEVLRTDLVGKYIGEAGIKTRKKIKQAQDGIVFVDEAYRLIPTQRPDAEDFGLQALKEIMSVMDNGKVVVIFAGYSKPMGRVISSNEGFRRRVTKFFHFDDFSCQDLAKILHQKMSDQAESSRFFGFKLHTSCTVKAVAAMIKQGTTVRQRERMNGGLVDTMLVNARENLDSRIDFECKETDSLLTITLEDLEARLRLLAR